MGKQGININGPEGKNVTGEFAEDEIEALFSNFVRWKLIYRNVDLSDLKHPDEEKYENRGYDFIYELFEPLESIKQGVIVESKKIGDISDFTPSRLSEDIDTLKSKIKKAMNSQELHEDEKIKLHSIKSFRYAILCYRFLKFDLDKYLNTLKKCKISEKTRDQNFPVIFILSNDKLQAFVELKHNTQNLKFYSRRPHYGNVLEETDKLPLFHLFSDIIPFNDNGTTGILSFDTPSVESFLYIKDFSRHFNKTISNIIFVNCNHANEHIYNQYKSEITDFSNINPLYLSLEMNCGRNLKQVFK